MGDKQRRRLTWGGKAILILLFLLFLPAKSVQAAEFGEQEWQDWLQKNSSYKGVADSGCRVVTYTKMLTEAGLITEITPDDVYAWGLDHKAFSKGKCGYPILENGGFGTLLTNYANDLGAEVERIAAVSISGKKKTAVDQMILSYLEEGYYVSLMCKAHTTYVGREASLEAGTTIILDSIKWKGKSDNRIVYAAENAHYAFTTLYVYQITLPEPEEEPVMGPLRIKDLTEERKTSWRKTDLLSSRR